MESDLLTPSLARLFPTDRTEVPVNEYYEYFGPDYRLDVRPNNMENLNTREYLEKVKSQVFEYLRHVPHAPSVQGHVEPRLPHDEELDDEHADEDEHDGAHDQRSSRAQRHRDARVAKQGDLSDSEDEGEGGRRDRTNHRKERAPGIMQPMREKEQAAAAANETPAAAAAPATNGHSAEAAAANGTASGDVEMADV